MVLPGASWADRSAELPCFKHVLPISSVASAIIIGADAAVDASEIGSQPPQAGASKRNTRRRTHQGPKRYRLSRHYWG